MLTNKAYLGLIVHNGETYEGGFPAIVSRATFEKVQEVLKNRAKPRHSKSDIISVHWTFNLRRMWRGNYGAMGARQRRNIPLLSLHQAAWLVFAKIFERGFAR